MNIKKLETALASKSALKRKETLTKLQETDYGIEVLPLLRRALEDEYVEVVIEAANCIAALGPEALSCPAGQRNVKEGWDELDSRLMVAGGKVWSYSGYANCYSACLNALLKLKVDDAWIVEYVHQHIGLSNPDDLLHSLAALKTIGTPEALDLFRRAVAFWLPELNKTFTKKVQALAITRK
jgi:hypothetical protein